MFISPLGMVDWIANTFVGIHVSRTDYLSWIETHLQGGKLLSTRGIHKTREVRERGVFTNFLENHMWIISWYLFCEFEVNAKYECWSLKLEDPHGFWEGSNVPICPQRCVKNVHTVVYGCPFDCILKKPWCIFVERYSQVLRL